MTFLSELKMFLEIEQHFWSWKYFCLLECTLHLNKLDQSELYTYQKVDK